MPRPRKRKMQDFPPGVYFAKGRYFVRHADGKETKLAGADATRQQVWAAFLKVPQQDLSDRLTQRKLAQKFMASERFAKLTPGTKKDYTQAFDTALNFKTKDDVKFGDYFCDEVTVGVMRKYMDKRGTESMSRANREFATFSSMYSWAFEREIVLANPCKGIKKFTLKSRTRYVEDAEYQERYDYLGKRGRPDMQAMMEVAFLCRLRENEILKITDSNKFMLPEGLLASRGKGSKPQIIAWTPRLQAAVSLARSVPRRVSTPFLFVSPHTGEPLTIAAFKSFWGEVKRECAELGHATNWTFHDLKAKGISDVDGDKFKASGHKTPAMTFGVYDRKLPVVDPTR